MWMLLAEKRNRWGARGNGRAALARFVPCDQLKGTSCRVMDFWQKESFLQPCCSVDYENALFSFCQSTNQISFAGNVSPFMDFSLSSSGTEEEFSAEKKNKDGLIGQKLLHNFLEYVHTESTTCIDFELFSKSILALSWRPGPTSACKT